LHGEQRLTKIKTILVSNDDGVNAPGIRALADELAKIARVIIVAPTQERSAQSQAITITQPLRLHELSENVYAVDGTPADCVMLSLQHLLEAKPDWVVSGINRGGNLGTDILYSGTVGAALEACIAGCKAMAISLEGIKGSPMHYQSAAQIARRILEREELFELQANELLNVNVPDFPYEEILGLKTASVGRRIYEGKMWERNDPQGRPYYWIGAGGFGHADIAGSDCVTLYQGYATVSVLKADFYAAQATDGLNTRLAKSNFSLKDSVQSR
jgi:5'-nucleotidase